MKRFFFIFCFFVVCAALPISAHAATLFLSPSSASHDVGDDFSVSVRVNTAGVAINAAQATVSFPTSILEVRSVSKSGTFSLWPVEPSYSNSAGTVRFGGGVPTPGYTGSSGTIITITFRGKADGTATVSIGSASVLANDGLGTNVLTSSGHGTYTISTPPPPKPVPVAPTISSSTHPDQERWYNNNDPLFEWTQQSGVTGFSYALDDQERTTPDTTQDSTDRQISYADKTDGTWYFHVRAKNENGWGATAHYRVRIDTAPPDPFSIQLLDGVETTLRQPRLRFAATDSTSGISHYTLSVNNGVAINVNTDATDPYIFTELSDGTYSVVVYAFDNAGNSTKAEASFSIRSTVPGGTNTNTEPEPVINGAPLIPEEVIKILPGPIHDIARSINRSVQQLQNNRTVSRVVDDVVEPAVVVTAVVAVTGVAIGTTGLELFNMVYLFFRFGYFWLIPISLGKKKKPWGVVFDGTTGKPVRRAIVRLFSKEFSKLRESQITDHDGRFGFLIDPGEYFIVVECPGYVFPSRFLKTAVISLYDNIYRGAMFTVKEKRDQAITYNIPIDPEVKEVASRRLVWLRILNILGVVLEKLNVPLLVGGTLISWLSLVLQPKLINYTILSVYAFLLLLRMVMGRRFQKSWGLVTDISTGAPIEYAVVRIYNMATGTILGTRVTNRRGQLTTLVPPGQYYVMVSKNGYARFQSKPIEVKQRHGMLRMSIQLIPLQAHGAKPGDTFINLEPMTPGAAKM